MDGLPNEILLEIFKRLSSPDLLALIETSRRFESLVTKNPSLMRKVPIQINCQDLKSSTKESHQFESQRKYQKIVIKNFSDADFQFIFKVFSFYSNCITHVKFVRANFEVDRFLDLLTVFQEIRMLELDQVFFKDPLVQDIGVENVRTLRISSCNREIFNTIVFKNLTSFEANYTPLQIHHWEPFLKYNPTIKKLVIRCTFGIDLSDQCINLITKSLKDLEHFEILDKFVKVNNEVYKIISQNCPNLKYLKLWNINIEQNFTDNDKNYLRSKGINCQLFNDTSLSGGCFQIM